MWLLALLAAILVFPGLGSRDLWNPDEARYAEVAREMAADGHVFVPQLNGEVYAEKPPLFFWAIELSGLLTGEVDETAARIPSALAAIGSVLLIFAMARRLFNCRAAWLAAGVFATCSKVLWQSRFGQIDMLLTFWVTLAMWLWLRGWLEDRPRLSMLFFVVCGVATLTKGPVGLLPVLLSILAFLGISGRRHELSELRLDRGLLIWAAVVLAWLVPAGSIAGLGYVEQMVLKQSVTRFVFPWHHQQPFYYYLTVLPVELLPWSLFLPAALRLAPAEIRRDGSGSRRDGVLLSLCWIAVTLLFFSLSPAKRSVYILPLYPALALLLGSTLDRLAESWPRYRGWVLWPLAGFAAVLALVAGVLPVLGAARPELEILGRGYLWTTLSAVCVLLLATSLALALAWRRTPVAGAIALATGMSVFWLISALALLPPLDVFKSARSLAGELTRCVAPDEAWTVYPRLDAGFLFYSGRYAHRLEGEVSQRQEIESLQAFVRRPGRVWVVAQRKRLTEVEGLPPLYEAARDREPEKGFLLLTNRPLVAPCHALDQGRN